MSKKLKARIVGLGSYLPEKVLSNQDLEKIVDTSDEWIFTRTGMKERRIAADDEHASDMGAKAAERALQDAGLQAGDVELILVATMSPDYPSPATASLIQHLIGAKQAAAADVQAMCTGFIYALSSAKAYVESGMYSRVLVVASEKMSALMDYTDRATCVLFGDGAAAAVVANTGPGLSVEAISLRADGELKELLSVPGGGTRQPATHASVDQRQHYFRMAGKETFRHAVRRMASAAENCLDQAGIQPEEIRWLVPHQANLRIMDAILKQMELPSERLYKTIHKYGNTSASGIAIALDELVAAQALQVGERILLVAFGGGLTWGATILTKVDE